MSKNPFAIRKTASIEDAVPETLANTPSRNFAGERLVGMTFNMPETWHKEFKRQAVEEGISMRELLMRCYENYKIRAKS